ncbi:MAG: cytochrome c oxidase assembly protein [Pseudomonadota bacterium]|nr:cytochrome c oxidase assembly protein [Pseudomonadota bacterium]
MQRLSTRDGSSLGGDPSGARSATRATLAGVIFLLLPAVAEAHAVSVDDEVAWHWHWSWEPWVVACLAISAVLYAIGVARLWAHAGTGRGVSAPQVGNFVLGWLILVLALLSPLDSLGDKLFSAHMIQHELLMIAAAPLLVLGRPLAIWVWALPSSWRRSVGAFFHATGWRIPWLFMTGPVVAWVLHALALWLWHIPALFEAALKNEGVHTLQHISFLGTALIFWWSVLGTPSRRTSALALLSIFTTMVHTGALGAILTLSRTPWYPSYADTTFQFGVTPLQDQQIGGLVMWVPAGFVYIACGLGVAIRLFNRSTPPLGKRVAEAHPS